MKQTIFIVFLLLFECPILSRATAGTVGLNQDHIQAVKTGHPSSIPTVTTEGDEVTIKCDTILCDVNVVIRDQYGNVMHNSTQTIGPDETTIYVHDMCEGREKATIDLYYDRKHLTGFFEE